MLPWVLLPSVVHWVKSMAGSDQQVDSPVGAFLWMVLPVVLHQVKSMAGFDQQVDSPVGAFLWMVLPLVLHQVKSMAGSDQQVDSPVGACLWALVCGCCCRRYCARSRAWPGLTSMLIRPWVLVCWCGRCRPASLANAGLPDSPFTNCNIY